jgi:hypothetical protein
MMVPPIKEQEEIVKRLATRNVVKVKKKKKKRTVRRADIRRLPW